MSISIRVLTSFIFPQFSKRQTMCVCFWIKFIMVINWFPVKIIRKEDILKREKIHESYRYLNFGSILKSSVTTIRNTMNFSRFSVLFFVLNSINTFMLCAITIHLNKSKKNQKQFVLFYYIVTHSIVMHTCYLVNYSSIHAFSNWDISDIS